MDENISGVIALSPEWEAALREVARRRSKLHYKPAALLVMLDMMDASARKDGRVPFREYDERFHDLMSSVDEQGKENSWQPFLHLATGEQVWDLYRSGKLTGLDALLNNRTKANLQANADEARIRPHLFPYLRDEAGRASVRQAVLNILADDKPGDSQRLRDAYLSRRTVDHTSALLTQGEVYTREDLASLFHITDATLNTGIFQPKGTNWIWIFVTERKTPDRTQYEDRLAGDLLYWQGQTEGRKDALIIEHAKRKLQLLVFYRHRKYEYPGAGFRYEGPFDYVDHKGSRPTNFVLRRAIPTSSPEVADALIAVSQVVGRRQRGQGYRITPEARRAVEQHAMQKAETYYREQGWDVDTSVATTECFDMRCIRGTAELHVEVKGTTSLGEQIVLTRNEVAHAREQYPAIALAIVKNIEIEPGEPVTVRGGDLVIIEPWRIDDGTLACLAFSYDVPAAQARRPKAC